MLSLGPAGAQSVQMSHRTVANMATRTLTHDHRRPRRHITIVFPNAGAFERSIRGPVDVVRGMLGMADFLTGLMSECASWGPNHGT
jgi:hypothetical protein